MALNTNTSARLPMSWACSGRSVVARAEICASDCVSSFIDSSVQGPRTGMFARRPTRFIGTKSRSLERFAGAILRSGTPAGGKKLPPDHAVTGVSELAHPDVAEADLVRVILQTDRHVAMRLIARRTDVGGAALECHRVLHQHTVVQNRDACRRVQRAIGGKTRRRENDVIGLPLLGRHGR